MRRVSVVGNSGAGKTTLSRRLAESLGVPYLELDSVFHQPGWTKLPAEEFRARVVTVLAEDGWVIDGNYSGVRELVWSRADTVVWLDPPRHRVMRQVTWRTVRRLSTGEPLWNGNRERWRDMLSLDQERSIIVWAWTAHRTYRDRYAAALDDPAWQRLHFVRLRSRRDVERFLTLPRQCTPEG